MVSFAQDPRASLFFELLDADKFDLVALGRAAEHGVPEVKGLRAQVWKLCLGYAPPTLSERKRHLARKHEEYQFFVQDFGVLHHSGAPPLGAAAARLPSEAEQSWCGREQAGASPAKPGDDADLRRASLAVEDHPLSSAPGSLWRRRFQDEEMLAQIRRDVLRTHPDLHFFSGRDEVGEERREAMVRVLFIYAKLNPGIKYVQGMNELLAPLYYVFASDPDPGASARAEADAFFCFVELMAGCRDLFCAQLDNAAGGVRATLSTLGSALRAADPALAEHVLDANGVAPHYFAFRWITLVLTQEFAFPDVLRIWDAIISAPPADRGVTLLRVCLAMLLLAREELFQGDFAANMKLLQHYPSTDVQTILSRSREHDIVSVC